MKNVGGSCLSSPLHHHRTQNIHTSAGRSKEELKHAECKCEYKRTVSYFRRARNDNPRLLPVIRVQGNTNVGIGCIVPTGHGIHCAGSISGIHHRYGVTAPEARLVAQSLAQDDRFSWGSPQSLWSIRHGTQPPPVGGPEAGHKVYIHSNFCSSFGTNQYS